jgi:hypothetical protein
MRFLRQYIFSNALLKLMALGISLLLWATYNSEPYVEVGFPVTLEFTSVPGALEISGNVPSTAQVRVRGRSAFLRRLTSPDLTLRIDLSGNQEGDAVIRLSPNMVEAPFGANVVSVSPPEFHLMLVPKSGSSPIE